MNGWDCFFYFCRVFEVLQLNKIPTAHSNINIFQAVCRYTSVSAFPDNHLYGTLPHILINFSILEFTP